MHEPEALEVLFGGGLCRVREGEDEVAAGDDGEELFGFRVGGGSVAAVVGGIYVEEVLKGGGFFLWRGSRGVLSNTHLPFSVLFFFLFDLELVGLLFPTL